MLNLLKHGLRSANTSSVSNLLKMQILFCIVRRFVGVMVKSQNNLFVVRSNINLISDSTHAPAKKFKFSFSRHLLLSSSS